MTRPQHLLVTGAAGFLGSHLVRRLLAAGHHVRGVDNLSSGSRSNVSPDALGSHADRFELLTGDVSSVLATTLPGPSVDAIFHLAASVGVARVIEDPTGSTENNLDQTRAVIRFAHTAGSALLVASSSEVYGKCPVLPAREDADLVFGPTTSSRWSYGLAKALDEQLALDAGRHGGIRVVVTRLFNAIGTGQLGRYGMVVPRFIEAASRGNDLIVHGDGLQTRCFCDARDTADALTRLLVGGSDASGVFNVGGDQAIAIVDLAHLINERAVAAGRPGGRLVFRAHAEVYGDAFEEPSQRVPDLQRVRSAVGWEPQTPLVETIDRLFACLEPAGVQR